MYCLHCALPILSAHNKKKIKMDQQSVLLEQDTGAADETENTNTDQDIELRSHFPRDGEQQLELTQREWTPPNTPIHSTYIRDGHTEEPIESPQPRLITEENVTPYGPPLSMMARARTVVTEQPTTSPLSRSRVMNEDGTFPQRRQRVEEEDQRRSDPDEEFNEDGEDPPQVSNGIRGLLSYPLPERRNAEIYQSMRRRFTTMEDYRSRFSNRTNEAGTWTAWLQLYFPAIAFAALPGHRVPVFDPRTVHIAYRSINAMLSSMHCHQIPSLEWDESNSFTQMNNIMHNAMLHNFWDGMNRLDYVLRYPTMAEEDHLNHQLNLEYANRPTVAQIAAARQAQLIAQQQRNPNIPPTQEIRSETTTHSDEEDEEDGGEYEEECANDEEGEDTDSDDDGAPLFAPPRHVSFAKQ